jgi:TRAP-type mannitol/chloroaromatic compound transport system permease small subunit
LDLLRSFADWVDWLNRRFGQALAWLMLGMVLLQFAVVVMRYVFGIGSVIAQEAIVYMHATAFLLGASYTFLDNGHVRCDILYREARSKTRALVDLIGAFVFLLPVALMILLVSLPYVANAWAVLEGSSEGRLGIPAIFLLKTTMPLFAILLGLQGLSMAIHAALRLSGLAGLDDLDHFVGDIDPETRP